MKINYLTGIFLLLFFSWNTTAQTVLVPQSVTATVGPFNSMSGPVSSLTLNITPHVNSNTTFPYAPSTNFLAGGIGFVSSFGKDTGNITYTYSNPVSISQLMIWNAYFDFELDHSAKTIDLIFANSSGIITTIIPLTLPKAVASDLKPYVAILPVEVVDVKTVLIKINTLWGGNDISIRRIAFAGTGGTAGLGENSLNSILVYPNPASNKLTIYEKNIQRAEMFDLNGRKAGVELTEQEDHSILSWENIAPGMYQLQIETDQGRFVSKVMVD